MNNVSHEIKITNITGRYMNYVTTVIINQLKDEIKIINNAINYLQKNELVDIRVYPFENNKVLLIIKLEHKQDVTLIITNDSFKSLVNPNVNKRINFINIFKHRLDYLNSELKLNVNKNNLYFIDTEFIEDGNTIELISIAIVNNGRELYYQNSDCNFNKADNWIKENVFTKLDGFDVINNKPIYVEDNSWLTKQQIADEVSKFITGDNAQLWGYYSSYDFVSLCQLYGRMMDIPTHIPMYINDLLQLSHYKEKEIITIRKQKHNALKDAKWTRRVYDYLNRD